MGDHQSLRARKGLPRRRQYSARALTFVEVQTITNDDLAAEVDELKARLVAQVGDRSAARAATQQAAQDEKETMTDEQSVEMARPR